MKKTSLILCALATLSLSACGGSEGGGSSDGKRNAAGNTASNITNQTAVAPATTSKKSSNVDGMNGSIQSDWDKVERERMQSETAKADKDRAFKGEQADLDRKANAAETDKRLADKKEGRFMNTLKELMHMQVLAGMIHPDKCANKGFASSLKSTGQGLRDAMAPVEKAEAKAAATAPAPEQKPAEQKPVDAKPAEQTPNVPGAAPSVPATPPPAQTALPPAQTPNSAPTAEPKPAGATTAAPPSIPTDVGSLAKAAQKALAPVIVTETSVTN